MKIQTLIVGGGLAGLSCARELHQASSPYLLIEKENTLGGLCRTIDYKGFTFDYTGHFLHFHNPVIKQWVLKLVGKKLKTRNRHAVIYSQGTYSEYPYQENNAGLPTQTIRENVLGYLEAVLHQKFSEIRPENALDFKTWCLQAFGPGLSRHFMFPYNEKLWKVSLSKLTNHWMGRFVPSARVLEVLQGAFKRQASPSGYNATFLYPDHGGISILPNAIARKLPHLWTQVGLKQIDCAKKKAILTSGLEVEYQFLVSSLPLPQLANLSSGLPSDLAASVKALRATSIYNINLGLKAKQPHPFSWVYFPEKEFEFHRAGSVSACIPTVAPNGNASIYVEFSYHGSKVDPVKLGNHAVQKLIELEWIQNRKDIVARVDLNLPGAYVIYDQHRDTVVNRLLSFFRAKKIFSIGRYGRWEYGSMESAMEQGIETAREILSRN